MDLKLISPSVKLSYQVVWIVSQFTIILTVLNQYCLFSSKVDLKCYSSKRTVFTIYTLKLLSSLSFHSHYTVWRLIHLPSNTRNRMSGWLWFNHIFTILKFSSKFANTCFLNKYFLTPLTCSNFSCFFIVFQSCYINHSEALVGIIKLKTRMTLFLEQSI